MAEREGMPIRLHSLGLAALSAVGVWALASCAGKSIQTPPEWALAPSAARSEIPEEFRRRFDVREVVPSGVAPTGGSSVPSLVPSGADAALNATPGRKKVRERKAKGALNPTALPLGVSASPSVAPSGSVGFFPKKPSGIWWGSIAPSFCIPAIFT